ncbi:hypothetical protein OG369_40960 [Streptomyces sp. NBC_01221]|uniref:hypothetical protein n=1 Tax=Streptomyces sp. NBC_01221 TaxID=2903782 RepID=UPI002256B8C8|nr:hypothetical protein [Streptomyces sp. NBC_01221]MCX4792187.1 hypothetical protein [Streptomyces sp. NBC_01221]
MAVAATVAAFAMVSPASASAQQAVTLSSADANYSGSVVIGSQVVKANGFIEDTGFYAGASAFYVNVTTTTGSYNMEFATVNNGASYTFATRQKSFPGTFISAKASMCSWNSQGVWACGPSKTVG